MDNILEGYSTSEKEAYIASIASIATADRMASEDEQSYLSALCNAADIDDIIVMEAANDTSSESLKSHLNTLKSSDLKFSLVADIISFAKADGMYSAEEENKISEIGNYLGVSPQQTNTLGSFVDKRNQISESELKDESVLENNGLSSMLKNAGIPTSSILKGLLGIAAPIIISKIFRSRSGNANSDNAGGGLLGSLLGNSTGGTGGLLGSLLGGSQTGAGGGLGSILSNLSGGKGYGGLGTLIGKMLNR